MSFRVFLIVLGSLLAGCGQYADYGLPLLKAQPGVVSFSWDVHPGPVLVPGSRGAWDGTDALNPSVVERGGLLVNLYSGYDGKTWHTGLATSTDGLNWHKLGKVFSPAGGTWEGDYIAANGAVLDVQGELLHWYQAGRMPRIGLARSDDGRSWARAGEPVLSTGPRGSWDERGVADPYVVRFGETFYMYYLGQDRARRQRLGAARSRDGVHWEKLRSNPVLEIGKHGGFDETGLGEPAVWSEQGSYWMLYTARDRQEQRRLGLARSQDGVKWARVGTLPVLSGSEGWNSRVVCDPTVLPLAGGGVRVWYGGGNVASPDENLNGQIGYATFRIHIASEQR